VRRLFGIAGLTASELFALDPASPSSIFRRRLPGSTMSPVFTAISAIVPETGAGISARPCRFPVPDLDGYRIAFLDRDFAKLAGETRPAADHIDQFAAGPCRFPAFFGSTSIGLVIGGRRGGGSPSPASCTRLPTVASLTDSPRAGERGFHGRHCLFPVPPKVHRRSPHRRIFCTNWPRGDGLTQGRNADFTRFSVSMQPVTSGAIARLQAGDTRPRLRRGRR
jgi:hypothetical protein